MSKIKGLFGYVPKNSLPGADVDWAANKRVGLLGGLSWESTARYYTLFNEMSVRENGPWSQPAVIIDSLDFSQIVRFRRAGDWVALGRVLADSARRLESGGATVLGIGANTMHRNYDDVAGAVSIPVLDVRDAMVNEVKARGASAVTLLGTKYLVENTFYSSYLERAGVFVVKPDGAQIDELQAMIDKELVRGVVTEQTRERFVEIVSDCQSRGGQIVGLCCTEFGLLMDEVHSPWPYVDSVAVHVKALLDYPEGA
jgi:aspartate racemase